MSRFFKWGLNLTHVFCILGPPFLAPLAPLLFSISLLSHLFLFPYISQSSLSPSLALFSLSYDLLLLYIHLPHPFPLRPKKRRVEEWDDGQCFSMDRELKKKGIISVSPHLINLNADWVKTHNTSKLQDKERSQRSKQHGRVECNLDRELKDPACKILPQVAAGHGSNGPICK